MNEQEMLTVSEAYDAMFAFIVAYWERGEKSSDELAVMLGSMNRTLFTDRGTADPAQWHDWERAVASVKAKRN